MSDTEGSEGSDYTFGDVPHANYTGHHIQQFPIGVLQRMFKYWHAPYVKNLLSAVKSGRAYEERGMEAPFDLAEICREFRAAMQETPELWTVVYVNFTSGNEDLIPRLHELLHFSKDERLTIIFQSVNVQACETAWYQEMHKILEPIKFRWATVAVSYARPQDLVDCWNRWPLLGSNVSDLRVWGSVQAGASRIPVRFLQGGAALKRLELRNVAWIHKNQVSLRNVARLRVGPSVDEVLGHSTVMELCASFPAITSLSLVAFETSTWTTHAGPLPATFALEHLTHLTVSPVLLATSLQGFEERHVIPALMSCSIRFRQMDEELEGDEEAEESTRRSQEDLAAVGTFLKEHEITTLKLRGLDGGYAPLAVRTHLFEKMATKKLANLYLEECSGHTTEYIEMVLTKFIVRELPPNRLAGARSVPRTSLGGEATIRLIPRLQYLYVYKCDDIDVTDLPTWVRDAPKTLKDVVIRGSKREIVEEERYIEAKGIINNRRM